MKNEIQYSSVLAAAILVAAYSPHLHAQTAAPSAGAFEQALASDYQALSAAERAQGDERDALTYSRRASAAAEGQPTAPDLVELRLPFLKNKYVSELSQARARLVTALDESGRTNAPADAARAQASYDCWLEQSSEDLQPEDINACRDSFLAAIVKVEAAASVEVATPPPPPAPPPPAAGTVLLTLEGTHFDFDKSTLRPDAIMKLNQAVQLLNDNQAIRVAVDGHTDSVGSDAYNQSLSERRANAVVDFLVGKGIDRSRLTSTGYGEARPVDSNDTAEGRARNRRVDLIVAE